ncbi:MAG TPA: ATP-binding cassette domain-containing protein, partial [Puia sp.]|nr:ATP-binding cassette domain-containing protein [Puia sp.]
GAFPTLDRLDWTIREGEQWAITGPSGSGKTVLAHTLIGRHYYTGNIQFPLQRIAMVEQQHRFRKLPGATDLYYQQRFNSSDADRTITVGQELAEYAGWKENGYVPIDAGKDADWLDRLHIRPLLDKPLVQLSNGENKRVQLAIALLGEPEFLILDNPFLGLDTEGRSTLHQIIDDLAAHGKKFLLITGEQELPASITHVARLNAGKLTLPGTRNEVSAAFSAPVLRPDDEMVTAVRLDAAILDKLRATRPSGNTPPIMVKMVDTTIRYGEATILRGVNWVVKKGERWSLSGPNGAGKSTLLSLITADNPQAYANEIWLFGRRRGTGESIWDIKRMIGFVSPELHLYFDTGASCREVIASGLFDTIGLFRPLSPEQEEVTSLWMRLLSLQELRNHRLAQLSTGQQRMVLLARALIRNPPMLILDEPCQGLDNEQTAQFRELITILCDAFNKTLIYVSHYRQELPSCIDHYLQLDKGEVLAIT